MIEERVERDIKKSISLTSKKMEIPNIQKRIRRQLKKKNVPVPMKCIP